MSISNTLRRISEASFCNNPDCLHLRNLHNGLVVLGKAGPARYFCDWPCALNFGSDAQRNSLKIKDYVYNIITRNAIPHQKFSNRHQSKQSVSSKRPQKGRVAPRPPTPQGAGSVQGPSREGRNPPVDKSLDAGIGGGSK